MNDFSNHIINLFNRQNCETRLPVLTPFPGVFLPQHRLIIHCIPLAHKEQLPLHFCAELSNKAQENDLIIIHVWEDVWMRNQPLIDARLLALIGIRKRIHARKTKVERIDKQQASAFLTSHHVQQYVSAYYKYALIHEGEIVAVATFSKSRVMSDGVVPYRSYELIRFASKTGTTVTGGLGKLLSHFITQHHPSHIMTYADRDWGNGEGYSKLGFNAIEKTPPQLFNVHAQTFDRLPADPARTVPDGYIRVMNAGNIKFVMDRRIA